MAPFAGDPHAGAFGAPVGGGGTGGAAAGAATAGGGALEGAALAGGALDPGSLDDPYGRPSGPSGARMRTFEFAPGAGDALESLEPGAAEEEPLNVWAFAAIGAATTKPASESEAIVMRRFTLRR